MVVGSVAEYSEKEGECQERRPNRSKTLTLRRLREERARTKNKRPKNEKEDKHKP